MFLALALARVEQRSLCAACVAGIEARRRALGLLGQSQTLPVWEEQQGHRELLQGAMPKASSPSCLVSLGGHYKELSRDKGLKYGERSSRKPSL